MSFALPTPAFVQNVAMHSTLLVNDYTKRKIIKEYKVATITLIQAASYACQAGFHGNGLYTIMSIAQFESGFNTEAVNSNDPNGGSYGILQINGIHFGQAWSAGEPNMSKEQALDPQRAFKFAYFLSKNGTVFTPWSTWAKASAPIIKEQMERQLKDAVLQLACHITS